MDGMSDGRMWEKAANVAKGSGNRRISLNHGGVHVDEFARFLAKIGHSFAVAERGLNNFAPFLLNAILNKRPMYLSYYVGMTTAACLLTPDVHEINLREEKIDGHKLLIVRIELFADIGGREQRQKRFEYARLRCGCLSDRRVKRFLAT